MYENIHRVVWCTSVHGCVCVWCCVMYGCVNVLRYSRLCIRENFFTTPLIKTTKTKKHRKPATTITKKQQAKFKSTDDSNDSNERRLKSSSVVSKMNFVCVQLK